ncbi:MAG: hypothetical protein ACYTKD_13680 [Planctomycetota bacterium]
MPDELEPRDPAEEVALLRKEHRSPGPGFGLRAGHADFTSDKGEIDGTPLFGLFLDRRKGGRLACEVGLDYARPEAEDGSFESSLLFGRFDILLPAGGAGPIAGGYFLCGAGGVAESTSDLTGDYRNFVGVVNLGAGFGVADGRFDLRFTYTMPLGSHNVSAITLVSAGARF